MRCGLMRRPSYGCTFRCCDLTFDRGMIRRREFHGRRASTLRIHRRIKAMKGNNMLAGLSSHVSLDQSEAPELFFEDFAALLRTLFPGANHIGFYDSNGRSRWATDASDTPDLAIRVSKLLLQASANIQDCFAEKTKAGSAHIFAVRGPDDSLRGALAFSLIRSGYGRKSRRLRPHMIEATVTPLLRILGRA